MADPVTETGTAVPAGERGRLTIDDRVVRRVVEHVVERTTGLRGHTDRVPKISTARLPRTETEISGSFASVAVDIAAPWESDLNDLTVEVQEAIRERLHEITGLTVTRVSVTVSRIVRQKEQEPRVR